VTRPYSILVTMSKRAAAGWTQSLTYLLRGLAARGHRIVLACPADCALIDRLAGTTVEVVPFDFGRGWEPGAARRLAALVRETGVELVNAQESLDRKTAVLSRLLHRFPAKLVITRRQVSHSFPLEAVLYAAVADRIVGVSEGVVRSLPRIRSTVVRNGIDPARLSGAPEPGEVEALRSGLGLDPALPTLGMVSRRKDHETILRAVALLGRPVNVVFVGIEADARLRALEPTLPPGSRVAYTGVQERVLPYYRLLDVKVMATLNEGLSQAVLEALAVGVPVVCAASGGMPEVIRHGETGLLFPPADAAALAAQLGRLLDDPALGPRLVAGGRAAVQGPFHADRMVLETEALYAALLDGERRG
jgi:L-malate glycosyltransferase